MKTVSELSVEQMLELKQSYLTEHLLEVEGREPFMSELADANDLIDDWLIFDAYEGTLFSDNDFFCSAGR